MARNTQLVHVPVGLPEGLRIRYVVGEGVDGLQERLDVVAPIVLVDERPVAAASVHRKPSLEDRIAALERKAGIIEA